MGTKIFFAILAVLFVVCLAIGFGIGYSHVFAPHAYSVPDQDVAQTPAASAPGSGS